MTVPTKNLPSTKISICLPQSVSKSVSMINLQTPHNHNYNAIPRERQQLFSMPICGGIDRRLGQGTQGIGKRGFFIAAVPGNDAAVWMP
jgi:hypothetical protein